MTIHACFNWQKSAHLNLLAIFFNQQIVFFPPADSDGCGDETGLSRLKDKPVYRRSLLRHLGHL